MPTNKFKYLDEVKIVRGFYEGCEGILVDCQLKTDSDEKNSYDSADISIKKVYLYTVKLKSQHIGTQLITVNEDCLELVKDNKWARI